MQIDARGKACPMPVVMTEEALRKINEGTIDVLVDNEESALNVAGYAAQQGLFATFIMATAVKIWMSIP